MRLRYKIPSSTEKAFTIPGGLLVPILATMGILWLLSNLSKEEMIGTAIALLVLSLIYFFMKWFKKKQLMNPIQQ